MQIRKGNLACDPRGLIFEAYRIEGVTREDCRAIFFDWALGVPAGEDSVAHIRALLDEYGAADHPMTDVLEEGLREMNNPRGRRGGRKARMS
ncbi:MAG: hypothetical protein AAF826_05225 [Pseudomonadota bacterium]